MVVLAVLVFIGLQRITAGYGMAYTSKWGPAINNRTGWVVMELPAFAVMVWLWCMAEAPGVAVCVMAGIYLLHYFQRTFIFPLLMRGKSRMPCAIVLMGAVFNSINAYMIGGWLFYVAPDNYYGDSWLWSPLFVLGVLIFIAGMAINLHSDYIVRHLRKPGDSAHYIPRGGMYKYVTSANYFGEFTEWVGYAILTWSIPGAVFALWTFANLAPRSVKLHARYVKEFGDEYTQLHRRYILPFIF